MFPHTFHSVSSIILPNKSKICAYQDKNININTFLLTINLIWISPVFSLKFFIWYPFQDTKLYLGNPFKFKNY